MSDRAASPLTTTITSSEKPPVGRQCPAWYFSKFCTLLRKIHPRTVLPCVYFEILYFELLDPEILSAVSSILRPLILSAAGSTRSCCGSAVFCDTFMHIYLRTTYLAYWVQRVWSGLLAILHFSATDLCTYIIRTYYLPCVQSGDPSA